MTFRGRFTKKQYRGGDYLKKGAWAVCRFKGEGLARKRGVLFLKGVDTPMRTMSH